MSHLIEAMMLKAETLYVSVSIMDKYLINWSSLNKKAPCLVSLGVTSIMIAAKLEEAKKCTFKKLSKVMEERHNIKVDRSAFR